MKIIKHISFVLFWTVIVYGLIAWISQELSIAIWTQNDRRTLIIVGPILGNSMYDLLYCENQICQITNPY